MLVGSSRDTTQPPFGSYSSILVLLANWHTELQSNVFITYSAGPIKNFVLAVKRKKSNMQN